MKSILSYSKAHFHPERGTYYDHSSAGCLARRLYGILRTYGSCTYFDQREKPSGLSADLLIGEIGNFEHLCLNNRIGRKVLWCSIPIQDHRALELCDLAAGVGNRTTLGFFPEVYRCKVRLANYGIGSGFGCVLVGRKNEFVYPVSEVSERKGFRQVMEVWKLRKEKLHILGYMNHSVMQALFKEADHGQMAFHGYIPSDTEGYVSVLNQCRFVYLPTSYEGQVGTLLEAMHSGLLALTTLESGLDEHVLEHAFLAKPKDVKAQSEILDRMVAVSEEEYAQRQSKMLVTLKAWQNWEIFDRVIKEVIENLT